MDGGKGLDEKPSLQQKRDEFIVDIRREERMSLINQKKFYSMQDKIETGSAADVPFNYLQGRSDAATLIPHITQVLEMDPEPSQIPQYIEMLVKGDLYQKHTGVIMLRKCLSIQEKTPIQEVIDGNAVPNLIGLIADDNNPHLQIEATWAVTNIATGSTLQTNSLVEKGIIPIYISLLSKSNIHLVEQAVWGIGNIAADCISFRNQLINNGAMEALVKLYEQVKGRNQKLKEQAIWAASNLCRLKPPPDISKVYRGIPMFAEVLLETSKQGVLTDCCWGLSQTCRSETLKFFIKAGIIKKIIALLFSPQIVISHPCLRIIGVFTNAEDESCQLVIDNGGLEALEHLLNSTTKTLRKEALWAISNITAGSQNQIGAVISRSSLLDKLFTIVSTDVLDNKIEAIWSVCNSTKNASFDQISYLMSKGLIDLFGEYLGHEQETKILNVILESLFVIAEKIKIEKPILMTEFINTLHNKGIIAKIESLQNHQNNNVYKKSYNFITTFLEVEDEL